MATSSKVQFSLAKLKEEALKSIDFRIAQLQERVDSYDSDAEYQRQIDAWRDDQIKTLQSLCEKVNDGTVTDIELEGVKLRPKPTRDRYQHDKNAAMLAAQRALRSRVVAKAESLVPDEDGNLALTKTQLQEFFDI